MCALILIYLPRYLDAYIQYKRTNTSVTMHKNILKIFENIQKKVCVTGLGQGRGLPAPLSEYVTETEKLKGKSL